jgi:glycosyltransferase
MTEPKRISIIVASYGDPRIVGAIRSIRSFDDIGTVKIVLIDGGSSPEIQQLIRASLREEDIFISERDRGIFDALNKGLEACDTEFIGWLGSDDVFTGNIKASTVAAELSSHDLLVANTVLVQDISAVPRGNVVRMTHALPSRCGGVPLGLHNPHYSTFGSANLLRSERFRLDLKGADIDYFLRIFKKKPRVQTTNIVATVQGAGGFSTHSWSRMLRINTELIGVYSRHANWLLGPIAVAIKVSYKLLVTGYYRIHRIPVSRVLS